MEQKSFARENIRPIAFTLLVLAAGTAAMAAQGYFSQGDAFNPMVYSTMQVKLYMEGSEPKLFGTVPAGRLSGLKTIMGDPEPASDSMVIGSDEARMMAVRFNITAEQALWGYEIPDFFGAPIKVSGVLKKTGSLADMVHFMQKPEYDLRPGQELGVKFTEDKMPKFFYYINADGTNWPQGLRFSQGGVDGFKPVKADRAVINADLAGLNIHLNQNRTYVPLVLGAEEAKMMIDEKLINGVGDRLDGFFGRDAYVAGILEPSNTSLDMLHYMPEA
jgi:hypothetical protein